MSLRARLVTGVLALVVVAAIALSLVTTTALRSFLISRIDNQLLSAEAPFGRSLPLPSSSLGGVYGERRHSLAPTDFFVEVADPSGNVVSQTDLGLQNGQNPPPQLSPQQLTLTAATANQPFTVAAQGDSSYLYRTVLRPLPDGSGTLVLAAPLQDVGATVHRVILIEVLAAVAVLILVALVSLWLVRVGLKPLDDMASTAGRIAAGDLSQRIDENEPRTEVGRLGRALNEMLSQIERAFKERARSEQRLRDSEQRLRTFVADASHELRTPLTSIQGYAELFRQGAVSGEEEVGRAMARIEENSNRMASLVQDLLLLARLDQDPSFDWQEVDLGQLARDSVADAEAVEPDRPISLSVEGTVRARGDEGRLRQAIANLLSNVRVHTPPTASVEVRVAREGDTAVVEVADHGPGMDDEVAEHVFERFYRADPSRSRAAGGNGLGLSIVAALAQAHGGRAAVSSKSGEGSTFRIELPAATPGDQHLGESSEEPGSSPHSREPDAPKADEGRSERSQEVSL